MLIGEVSRQSGVSTRMLRHYDRLGLVRPTGRTSGGYREYSADDIRRLFRVECLRTLGLSLTEVGQALDEPGFTPAELVGELIRHTRARITAQEELLRKLERVEAAAPAQWGDVIGLVTLLRALESESGARRQQAILAQHRGTVLPVETLVQAALSEEDPNVAGALLWSLARAGDEGLPDLAAGLDSPRAEVRRRATSAIAAVPTSQATDLLLRALGDREVAVRDRAAVALGSRQVAEAVPALLDMVTAGRSDVEAAETLGLLAEAEARGREIVGELRDLLEGNADPAVRLRITQAFAEIPGDAAREALAGLTRDADRTIAGTAAAILHR